MENGDKTAEGLEMAAVKECNHTHAADDIDWPVAQINCHCQCPVRSHYPRSLNCHHDTVVSQLGYPVEPYSLCSVEVPSSTWSVNKDGGKLL